MLFLTLSLILSSAFAQTLSGNTICQQIQANITGDVYYPLSSQFQSGIEHYFASSQQTSTCVVEVDSIQDVSHVIKLVGSTRTPFAIKSGGHSSNQGYSSTTGVQISFARLKQVNLSADKKTVEVGMGNLWSDVYNALNATGVNVVGGRVPGPGVGGFSLGGGYAWLTQQYGLTSDTIKSYNLVFPNGTIALIDEHNTDMFFALKGGLNRFGVVTSINYNTVPQPNLVYAGLRIYEGATPALNKAVAKFQATNTDPKAQLLYTVNGGINAMALASVILLLFYDGPEKPAIFDLFENDDLKPLIDTVKPQYFADFEAGIPSELTAGGRGAYHTMPLTDLTEPFLKAIVNESEYYGALSLVESATVTSYDIEPFITGSKGYGKYAKDSAFPHANSPLPLNLYYGWSLEANDNYWRGVMQQSVNTLTAIAKAEGIYSEDNYAYPNYALSTYSGDQIYGPTNAARLRKIQAKVDPDGVMKSLAGGFSI